METRNVEKLLQPKKPNPWFRRLLAALPWFWLWITINGVGMKVSALESQYKDPPVLVQVGAEAKPFLAQQVTERHLNALNVQAFVHEVVPILWRLNAKLPEEMGGGVDPGVKMGEVRVPTPMYMAKAAVVESIADSLVTQIVQSGPKELWRGASATVSNLQVSEPEGKTPTFRTVIVTGLLRVDAPDGTPLMAQPWARKLKIIPVQKPKFLLKKSAIEEKYNLFLMRGLQISSVQDAKEVLP